MRSQDTRAFVLLGLGLWAAGTALYRSAGAAFFEVPAPVYWLNAVVTAAAFCGVFWAMVRRRRVEPAYRLQAALAMALPGMLGEVPVLYAFPDLMVNLRPESAGRYAAFLFGGYAALLLFAWVVSGRQVAAGR